MSQTPTPFPTPSEIDNLGPLSTFTPPQTCLQTTTQAGANAYYVAAFWDDVPACYPNGTTTAFNFHTMPQYFSPGVCPVGWKPVTSAGADAGGGDGIKEIWLCCPTGYTYSGFKSDPWYKTNDCEFTLTRGQQMTNLLPSGSTNVEEVVTMTTTVRVLAKGIIVMWESTDQAVVKWAQTATSPENEGTNSGSSRTSSESAKGGLSSLGVTGSDVTNAVPSNTPTQTSSSISGGGGLSTGAKAGIGIGVAIGVIALLLLGFWIGKRRKPDVSQKEVGATGQMGRVDEGVPEMETSHNMHEAQTNANAHELADGSWGRPVQLP